MSQMHQIRFPASVCPSVRSFVRPFVSWHGLRVAATSTRRDSGDHGRRCCRACLSVRPSVRLLDGGWHFQSFLSRLYSDYEMTCVIVEHIIPFCYLLTYLICIGYIFVSITVHFFRIFQFSFSYWLFPSSVSIHVSVVSQTTLNWKVSSTRTINVSWLSK